MTKLVVFDNYYLPTDVTTSTNIIFSPTYTSLYIGINSIIQGDAYDDIIVSQSDGIYTISTGQKGDPSLKNYIMNAAPYDSNSGSSYRTAFGVHAGEVGQSDYAVAMGYNAGQTNQNVAAVAVGYCAGQTDQDNGCVAVGYCAGQLYQGIGGVAVGFNAGQFTQGSYAIAVGAYSGENTQGNNSVAVGAYAGQNEQGTRSVAVGYGAGQYNQGADCVAFGYSAGQNYQGLQSICIGSGAGNGVDSLQYMGQGAIAIGYNCCANTSVPAYSIALGADCLPPQAEGRLALGSHMEALATTASAGANGAPPGQVAGYITFEHNGSVYKIPLYL